MPAASPETKKLSALLVVDRKKWVSTIHGALKKQHGNVAATARELGVSTKQLWRMIHENPSVLENTGHKLNPGLKIDRT